MCSYHLECVMNKLLCIWKLARKQHCIMLEWKSWCHDVWAWLWYSFFFLMSEELFPNGRISPVPWSLGGLTPCLQRSPPKMVPFQVFSYDQAHNIFKFKIIHLLLSCGFLLHGENVWRQDVMGKILRPVTIIETPHLWKSDCGVWILFAEVILMIIITSIGRNKAVGPYIKKTECIKFWSWEITKWLFILPNRSQVQKSSLLSSL